MYGHLAETTVSEATGPTVTWAIGELLSASGPLEAIASDDTIELGWPVEGNIADQRAWPRRTGKSDPLQPFSQL